MVSSRSIARTVALLLAASLPAVAQTNPMKNVEAFTVDGINVILNRTENDLVSAIVGFEGGIATGETDNPALGPFTSDLITSSGTPKYTKEEFRRFVSLTSSGMWGEGDLRGISYQLTSTRQHFDKTWDMLTSMVLQSGFDTIEYRNIMQQRIVSARRRWSTPEASARITADSLITLGNPLLSKWTREEDVRAVTIPMMQAFQAKLRERSRMLVVIVGKFTAEEIKAKLKPYADLPMGNYKRATIPALTPNTKPDVHIVDRSQSPTTYVSARFVGPKAGDKDFWPMMVGMSYLSNRLFEEVRTKRNLSYAPGSGLSTNMGQGVGLIVVSSTMPDSAISVMYDELEKMRQGKFDETDLNDSKQVFITNYYQSRMTTASKAQALYSAQRNVGDWRYSFSYDEINAVTKADVERVFRKYARNLQVGVAGKPAGVTEEKYMFGEETVH